jgi:uncharacterized protein YprB with RNaseH-like and TPR domain
MDYFNLESFEITQLIEEYSGRNIEEVFKNHKIIENELGEFMDVYWEEINEECNLDLQVSRKRLLHNLKAVYYVGEITEKQLIKKGIKNLFDLTANLKYNKYVRDLLALIKTKNYNALLSNRYINDLDLSFCFNKNELLFLDIETLGMYDSPMIIVGIGFYKDLKYEIHQFFARNLEEEIAICEHLRRNILPHFKCFVTYNGKSFDIPYIANRFLYFFDENPMINENETPYENSNTKHHHIDLYHNCRREFKGLYSDYTLKMMEEKVLGWKRENELPSSLVGTCYKRYLKNPKRYIGLIKECLDHNLQDILSLPLILEKLLM